MLDVVVLSIGVGLDAEILSAFFWSSFLTFVVMIGSSWRTSRSLSGSMMRQYGNDDCAMSLYGDAYAACRDHYAYARVCYRQRPS